MASHSPSKTKNTQNGSVAVRLLRLSSAHDLHFTPARLPVGSHGFGLHARQTLVPPAPGEKLVVIILALVSLVNQMISLSTRVCVYVCVDIKITDIGTSAGLCCRRSTLPRGSHTRAHFTDGKLLPKEPRDNQGVSEEALNGRPKGQRASHFLVAPFSLRGGCTG